MNCRTPTAEPGKQMRSLNVLVVVPGFERSSQGADKQSIRMIRAVDPRIRVKDGAALTTAERRGDYSQKKKLDSLLAWADVIFGLTVPPGTIARASQLKWIQVISAGVDRLIETDIWRSPVLITTAGGIHATPIGEFVMALMLMFAKNAPRIFAMMQTRQWKRFQTETLRGKTVGIIGLGNIGREVARLSRSFGMHVIATRRSAVRPRKARNVDLLLPQAKVKQMLARSDYVVLCVPLTPQTRNIVGWEELKAMKRSARLINIGRGALVNEGDLIRALEEKMIGGAGLDVTETEPLPRESPLWNFDNVILSPHISGSREDYMLQATGIFCSNLRRFLGGKKLINLVDRKRGY